MSGAEAQSIVGAALLAHKEAPLGPTCVFEFKGPTSTITMAIERLSFPKTVREMKQAKQSQVAGHQAECGMLGAQMLFISLSGGRVLNVTAPCSIARAIGARALLHLPV